MPPSNVLAIAALAILAGCGGPAPEPTPAQPIAFSHRLHVTTYRMGCTMCHVYATHSPIAGIPSMSRCAGCHRFVLPVLDASAAGRAIEWQRVHRVPDHVYFTHERHVAAGLACQTCHGAVEQMDLDRQVAPLTMGWCVDCHRARHAPDDCLTCHK